MTDTLTIEERLQRLEVKLKELQVRRGRLESEDRSIDDRRHQMRGWAADIGDAIARLRDGVGASDGQ